MYDLGAFGELSCGYMMSPSARMVLWSPTSMLSTLGHANCPKARRNTIVLRPDKPWGFSFYSCQSLSCCRLYTLMPW